MVHVRKQIDVVLEELLKLVVGYGSMGKPTFRSRLTVLFQMIEPTWISGRIVIVEAGGAFAAQPTHKVLA